MGTASVNLQIPKLKDNGSNWATYTLRMRAVFQANGVLHHIDEEEFTTRPTTGTLDQYREWDQCDVQGIALLYQSLSDTTLIQLALALEDTPHTRRTLSGTWAKLEELFDGRSPIHLFGHLSKMSELRYKPGSSVEAHVGEWLMLRANIITDGSSESGQQGVQAKSPYEDIPPLVMLQTSLENHPRLLALFKECLKRPGAVDSDDVDLNCAGVVRRFVESVRIQQTL